MADAMKVSRVLPLPAANGRLVPTWAPPSLAPIRLLLVTDHTITCAGLRLLIESRPAFCIVGEAGDCHAALAVAAEVHPHVVLLDLIGGARKDIEFLPDLLTAAGDLRVLALTGGPNPELHRNAIRLGVKGMVLKEHPVDTLFQAIETVHAGGVWLDSSLVAELFDEPSPTYKDKQKDPEAAKIALLSPRECRVVTLISEGLRDKEIATRLFVSETTVRHHLTSIFSKLGTAERLELVIYAFQHGLAILPPKGEPRPCTEKMRRKSYSPQRGDHGRRLVRG